MYEFLLLFESMSWLVESLNKARKQTSKFAKEIRGSLTQTVRKLSLRETSASEMRVYLEEEARSLGSKSDAEFAEILSRWVALITEADSESERFEDEGDSEFNLLSFREVFYRSNALEILISEISKNPTKRNIFSDPTGIPPPPTDAEDNPIASPRSPRILRDLLTFSFSGFPSWESLLKPFFSCQASPTALEILISLVSLMKKDASIAHQEDVLELLGNELDSLAILLPPNTPPSDNHILASSLRRAAELSAARVAVAEELTSLKEIIRQKRVDRLNQLLGINPTEESMDLVKLSSLAKERKVKSEKAIESLSAGVESLSSDSSQQGSSLEPERARIDAEMANLQEQAAIAKRTILTVENRIAEITEKKLSLKRNIAAKREVALESERGWFGKGNDATLALEALAERRGIVANIQAGCQSVTDALRQGVVSKEPRANEIAQEAVDSVINIMHRMYVADGLGLGELGETEKEEWSSFAENFESYLSKSDTQTSKFSELHAVLGGL